MASTSGNKPVRRGTSVPEKTSQTEQYMLNLSFDEVHQLLMSGMLAINMNQLGPDGSPGRYDRLQIDDSTGGLIVKLTGSDVTLNATDIEIGAVELKDGTSDTRGKIGSDGYGNNAVYVQNDKPVKTAEKYTLKPYAKERTASDTITPTSGKRIQLVWAQIIADPDNTAGNLITISMTIDGVLTDIYKVYALGRSAVFTGDTNTDLVITLETSEKVTVNLQYREIE